MVLVAFLWMGILSCIIWAALRFRISLCFPEIAVARIREDAPFDKVCYIGCGVTTGVGAVAFDAKVEPGSTVAVFGLGGIGLNVIQGAKMVGADRIIGFDINPTREKLGRNFGMNDFINPNDIDDVTQAIVDMTEGVLITASNALEM
ncbi:MAG: hypothetical protein CM1200mP40_23340 [Gammaproteobacteria bacterium]|nr:MAG: hypothetical protein CM1200mP40_23340 [Gammaproteobacteria bacterium]